MARTRKLQRIIVCTSCRIGGARDQLGEMLIREINAAIAITPLSEHVRVEGTGCMAGCSRPCTVAFCAPRKATYLFGDIGGGTDVEALVEFAKQYGNLLDGMSRSSERPAQLLGKTLARIPAAAPAERPRS